MQFFSTCASMGFADAVAATKKALERQKFAILTEIDMRQALKEVSPSILRPYLILSACSTAISIPGHQGGRCNRFNAALRGGDSGA